MKYLIVLGDGMADKNIPELDNRTPLDYADTPTMDKYSKLSEIGMVRTVPEGMAPGSDTANLSVMGYDPRKYYTGRSPLEALSIGVDMKESDVVYRCNLVTLTEEDVPYEEQRILDHTVQHTFRRRKRSLHLIVYNSRQLQFLIRCIQFITPSFLTKRFILLVNIRIKYRVHVDMHKILKVFIIAACYRINCLVRISHRI